jgi:hypothetical protein
MPGQVKIKAEISTLNLTFWKHSLVIGPFSENGVTLDKLGMMGRAHLPYGKASCVSEGTWR